MPIDLSEFSIKRLILHEVFGSDQIAGRKTPLKGQGLEQLPDNERIAIEKNLIKVMGRKTKSVALEIDKDGEESTFQLCAKLLDTEDEKFVATSYELALSLDKAQHSTNAPGGFVVVFDGITGAKGKRFIGVLKAEKSEGFNRDSKAEGIKIHYLHELFLTDDKKLFKIGLFQENTEAEDDEGLRNSEDFLIQVFDHKFTPSKPESAAKYFHQSFLGCKIPKSNRTETKKFYNESIKWAQSADLTTDEAVNFLTGLDSYLKSNEEVITVAELAERHLPERAASSLENYMGGKVPSSGIVKDTEFLKSQLKENHFDFGHSIRLWAPSQAFDNRTIVIEQSEDDPEITIIRVKGVVKPGL
jgi:hypothetical protein